MSLETLKWLRFVTPGFIIVFFAAIFGQITGVWDGPDLTVSVDTRLQFLPAIIAAAVYYLTPFRDIANRDHFDEVTEALRIGLVEIAGLHDDPTVLTWKKMRGVFFSLVDNDPSLSVKVRLAYWNGYIWTTLADIRAIAFVFAPCCALLEAFGVKNALVAGILFLLIATLTIQPSRIVTRRHKEIGKQQLEIIAQKYSVALKASLQSIK